MKSWDREWRLDRLKQLYAQWEDCQACPLGKTRKNIVFGEGEPNSDVVIVGEAPGEEEDETGDPFVGPSGQLLNDLLKAAGFDRENVFVTNLVMCRPQGNREPTKLEREACVARLHQQIYLVDPWLIIPVGKTAMSALMGGEWKSIQEGRGRLGRVVIKGLYGPVHYDAMPIVHPAFILRSDRINPTTNTWIEGGPAHTALKDLTKAKDILRYLRKQYQKTNKHEKEISSRLKVIE